MRTYKVTITGKTPLLMHNDDIEWSDRMEEWRADPKHKKSSKAGDDRSPAYRWIGSLYHDGNRLVIPTDNIMRSLMEGAAMVPIPGGKNGKTFKSQSQSGIMPRDIGWPILINGAEVPFSPIASLMSVSDFPDHKAAVNKLGFDLFVKRARIGSLKHVRVRPRFDVWSAVGELAVNDDQIEEKVLARIIEYAGSQKGLGDWRPGGKTPGTYGMFSAKVNLV